MGETPGLEEGPFWIDGQVQRVDVRPDSVTGVYPAGTPLYLGLTVSQLSDTAPYTITPLVGAQVDIWNANAQGVYSDEASESTTGTDYQRGYQLTSSHGVVNFLTNYSGWYSGRTPHVHIRIRTYSGTTVTYNWATQLFFDDSVTAQVFAASSAYTRTTARDAYNTTDRVLNGASENGSPETEAGDYTMMKLSNDGSYVMASFHIILDLLDTANADPTGGTENGGGGGGGGAPPGGGTPPGGGPGGPPPGGGGGGGG